MGKLEVLRSELDAAMREIERTPDGPWKQHLLVKADKLAGAICETSGHWDEDRKHPYASLDAPPKT
jgi:hypothetical protein